jgi:hypothetical protein
MVLRFEEILPADCPFFDVEGKDSITILVGWRRNIVKPVHKLALKKECLHLKNRLIETQDPNQLKY